MIASVLALATLASGAAVVIDANKNNINKYTATAASAVYAAQATAGTRSPTSHVEGRAFDRFVTIWLENTDYDLASTDPNLQWLAKQGVTLTNYYGVAHPSEPNYVAAIAGDNFGMDNDGFNQIPANISTVIDLLEDRSISWGTYQEGQPYAGFEGYSFINQTSGQNNYVRKHHPAPIFNSNAQYNSRLEQMKNFTSFYEDLENERLPQWLFITPNMLNDGHDTGVTYAGAWLRPFLEPLLANKYFTKNTLILVTFDETETYTNKNNVFSFLLGGAVPESAVGTVDKHFYNHYSEISTVEANWGLNTLGRWDVGANVFNLVAKHTGDKLRAWTKTDFDNVYLNCSIAGPMSAYNSSVGWPVPNVAAKHAGRTVLPSIKKTWGNAENKTWYTTDVEVNYGLWPPAGYSVSYDA